MAFVQIQNDILHNDMLGILSLCEFIFQVKSFVQKNKCLSQNVQIK
jgi:hypothetical protein